MKACRVRLGLFLQVLTATRSVKKVRYFQPLNHNQCRPGSEDPHRRHRKFKYKTNSNYFKFVFKFICKKEMQFSCPHSAPTTLLKAETKKKNIDDPEADLFSILYDLESMRNAEGVFHFKLCYPELAEDFPCNE